MSNTDPGKMQNLIKKLKNDREATLKKNEIKRRLKEEDRNLLARTKANKNNERLKAEKKTTKNCDKQGLEETVSADLATGSRKGQNEPSLSQVQPVKRPKKMSTPKMKGKALTKESTEKKIKNKSNRQSKEEDRKPIARTRAKENYERLKAEKNTIKNCDNQSLEEIVSADFATSSREGQNAPGASEVQPVKRPEKIGTLKRKVKARNKDSAGYQNYREKANKRHQKWLANLSDEKREERRRKDRELYKRKKEEKKIKCIADMSDREKKSQRKRWRENIANYRRRQRQLKNAVDSTPPQSDNELAGPRTSSSKTRGRKKIRRDQRKAYRKINTQENEISRLNKKLKTLRCSLHRKQNKLKRLHSGNPNNSPSPKTKVQQIIERQPGLAEIKKKLLFGEALRTQLKRSKENIEESNKLQEKQIFNKCLSGDVLKKYGMQKELSDIISYKQNRKMNNVKTIDECGRRNTNFVLTDELIRNIKEFFENDLISRMCPGKKDFIAKDNIQQQKRLLLMSVKEAHQQFVKETGFDVSYTSFWRAKPFWVIDPTSTDRETCLCLKHSNFEYMLKSLKAQGVIISANVNELLKNICCDIYNSNCMTNKCGICKENCIVVEKEFQDLEGDYQKWETVAEDRLIKGNIKRVKFMKKIIKRSLITQLVNNVNDSLCEMKQHVYNMFHQQKAIEMRRKNLKNDEILLMIDFSENYTCKLSEEVQSMHFGASKKQLSIHTGLVYYRGQSQEETTEHFSFATISENLEHGAHAIWAHLKPIFIEIQEKLQINIKTINFFSDGPTSQYRNRANIFYMLKNVTIWIPQIEVLTWNFNECGHGKGPMDGVGGSLKRQADKHVNHFHDIVSAANFVRLFEDSSTSVILVQSENIDEMKDVMPSIKDIPPITNIMSYHQITWTKKCATDIFTRTLSCFECPLGDVCKHFSPQKHARIKFYKCVSASSTISSTRRLVKTKPKIIR